MRLLMRALSVWPLRWLQAWGALAGWLAYALSGKYRQRLKAHAALAGLSAEQARHSIGHAGRTLLELPRLWLGKPATLSWDGLEWIDAAHERGRGIIFLTPHLGCFEITAQAYARHYAAQGKTLTVLYRPAKKAWLTDLVASARRRPGLDAAPATMAGVKALVKALRNGQALGILPDQVPPAGLGLWAPFFGQPAYSMTLPAKLAAQTQATVLLAWGERLARGAGYIVHVRPMPELSPETEAAVAQINTAMEGLIRECPEQYLWAYARYKPPAALQPATKGAS
jgi:Kdo2-lipid IVA lauroyltransferase/acyltransferase